MKPRTTSRAKFSSSTPANFRRQRSARRAHASTSNQGAYVYTNTIRRPWRRREIHGEAPAYPSQSCPVVRSIRLFIPVGFLFLLLFPAPHASRGGTAQQRISRCAPPSFHAHGDELVMGDGDATCHAKANTSLKPNLLHTGQEEVTRVQTERPGHVSPQTDSGSRHLDCLISLVGN